ncbi:MAG: PEP-CTERM sorting domain-containing protein [Phycisphaerae bacterium]|nr:PEP-CTERM sorting domain-containing protein [Phycisphaerae bacterium]
MRESSVVSSEPAVVLRRPVSWVIVLASPVFLSAAAAFAQPTFTIDFQGPTNGVPNAFTLAPITAADILSSSVGGPPIGVPAFGPLPPPGTVIPGGPGGLGVLPGFAGLPGEVDALSYGRDSRAMQNPIPGTTATTYYFSVDEFAVGIAGTPFPPAVWNEGAFGPSFEASADVFVNPMLPPGPLPPVIPPFPPAGNTGFLDGNGLLSVGGFVYPGLGLIEPNPPTPLAFPDPGDNLDGIDVDTVPADLAGPVYFSMDSAFIDPLEALPANTGTAIANGFVGGDVVTVIPGGAMALYAAAGLLGLDLVAGPDSDDLDALALWENGVPGYQPSLVPYDWMMGATDMLLFSVRRGSALIGLPDSIWGAPISEGDILTTPLLGGLSPLPGIFIPAEWIGLATLRSGLPTRFGFNDDLDALDVVPEPATAGLLMIGALRLLRRRRSR